jgi:anaphase-promoting complex subunit 2
VEYPESIPIIKDLKECLIKKNLTNELIQQIVKSFKKRLLIIGATTSDIITQYINMVRSLSILDPTEVALLKINPIMKEYLLKRNDAVSCIISDLIDEENDNELHKELINNDYIESNIDSEDEHWEPEPLYSNPR